MAGLIAGADIVLGAPPRPWVSRRAHRQSRDPVPVVAQDLVRYLMPGRLRGCSGGGGRGCCGHGHHASWCAGRRAGRRSGHRGDPRQRRAWSWHRCVPEHVRVRAGDRDAGVPGEPAEAPGGGVPVHPGVPRLLGRTGTLARVPMARPVARQMDVRLLAACSLNWAVRCGCCSCQSGAGGGRPGGGGHGREVESLVRRGDPAGQGALCRVPAGGG